MTGHAVAVARHELAALERASLIQEHLPDRYRMHDLIRLYAAEKAAEGGSSDRHATALRRLVEFTVYTAYAADRLLDRHRQPIDIDPPHPGFPLTDETAALQWFNAEHLCLPPMQEAAVAHAWYDRAWQMAWVQQTYRQRQGHLHALHVAWQLGLTAADRLGDPDVQALAHRFLGHAYTRAGDYDVAHEHLVQALAWSERVGDVPGQIHAHRSLAWVWSDRGDTPRALDAATRSLRLAQQHNAPVWEARAHNAVGRYSASLGRLTSALEHCTEALKLFRRYGDHDGEAVTINSLGYIAHRAGRLHEAPSLYKHALDMFKGSDNVYNEPLTLGWMAEVYALLGDSVRARASWERALHLYQVHGISAAERIRQHLAALDRLDTLNPHESVATIDPTG
jgi:tetratricopeptide (TPR) repeat protein